MNVPAISVKYALRNHSEWWYRNATPFIYEIIAKGFKIPLLAYPPPSSAKNNKSALNHPQFVSKTIAELLISGVVVEVNQMPHMLNPLTVADNSADKLRLVLDLRLLNPFVEVGKMKFENIDTASQFFKRNQYLATFDLKSGYHHIDIRTEDQTLLGFQWNNHYYTYTSLAFGLNVAGLIFTKVLRTLVKKWRAKSICVVLYIDDGILFADTLESCLDNVIIVREDLKASGFVVNEAKSFWLPKQEMKWLGFVFNTVENKIKIPQKKLAKVQTKIEDVLKLEFISAKELASFVGKITSLHYALGGLVYLLTKNCQVWISVQPTWVKRAMIPNECKVEFLFWKRNLSEARNLPFEKTLPTFTRKVYTDASGKGGGGFIEGLEGSEMVQSFSSEDCLRSSTWRELKTVLDFLVIHQKDLSNEQVLWYSDNSGVISILKKGSMVHELQILALNVFEICSAKNISLCVAWLPRDDNEAADHLSKIEDHDDWQIASRIFLYFQKLVGVFTLDPFAGTLNTKCSHFYSKWWCVGSAGVDAFCFTWKGYLCRVVPPPVLVGKTIKHLIHNRVNAVLVVPKWPSAAFWPILYPNGVLAQGFSLLQEYKEPADFFQEGVFCNKMFTRAAFSGNVLVLRVKF